MLIVTLLGVLLVLVVVVVAASLHRVPEGDVEALFVFGDMTAVLRPGLNFVPPFVSATYPIDAEAMVVRTDDGTTPVPDEYRGTVSDTDATEAVEPNTW